MHKHIAGESRFLGVGSLYVGLRDSGSRFIGQCVITLSLERDPKTSDMS